MQPTLSETDVLGFGKKEQCPICRLQAYVVPSSDGRAAAECERCGRFHLSARRAHAPYPVPPDRQPFLGAATRQSWEGGLVVELDQNDEDLARPHLESQYQERTRKLLDYIGKRCSRPGRITKVSRATDYTLADAIDGDELQHYIDTLVEQGLIKATWNGNNAWTCLPTSSGWIAIEPIVQTGSIPGRCFVALAFKDDMAQAYEQAIKPALTKCGYDARCMLELKTIEGITDRILAEIRSAEFVVADFTHHRPGVYFEAGFAKGLGRPVVWCVREDQKDQVHFDVKHLGHIFWKDTTNLRELLVETIRANIIRPE